MQAAASPKVAEPPFDGQNYGADIILRTSDAVDFYVHKAILSIASTYFKDLFAIPQPNDATDDHPKSLDAIPVSEDSQTIDYILRLCHYPVDEPVTAGLKGVTAALSAAIKYDLKRALRELKAKKILREHIDTYPLQVYFLASQYGWDDLADEAVNECITLPSLTSHDSYTRHMEDATAESYYSLLKEYHSATFPHPSYRPQATVGKKQKKKGKRK
ncbi:hypothetical protein K474DRAFT_1605603 [Panus rudis PR-1116 ss-1]|nr:hypothetical protein K474DRAFT_1605603 [Panus rudis PR-1116 ss-1]